MEALTKEDSRVGNVIWTEEEWRAVAVALMRNPLYKNGLPEMIGQDDLRRAMKVLPEHRHRTVFTNANVVYRKGLNKAFEQIRAVMDTPKAQADDDRETRIRWRGDEYLTLARELYRMSPSANYHLSTTLAGLTAAEIVEAQRNVLPADRRRTIYALTKIRPALIEAFKTVRAEIEDAETHATQALQQFRQPEPAKADPAPAPVVEAAVPAPAPEPTPEPAPVPVLAPTAQPEFNAHELALKVLCEMLAPALVDRLVPELAKRITALAPAAPAATPIAPAAKTFVPPSAKLPPEPEGEDPLEYGPPPGWQPPEFTYPADPPPPKLPLIGIIGVRPVQVQELKKAFPNIEFMTTEGHHSSKTLNHMQSAERVISVNCDNNSMNQLTDKMLAKHFNDRYVRINGGLSSVKRQIQVWISAGVLK
jgi:hypothetical protein